MNGYERLKDLYRKDFHDKAILHITKFLLSQTDMNEKYLNEEKSLKQMMEYICKKVEAYVINNVAVVEEDTVHNWALEYFNSSNEELGLDKTKTEIPKFKTKVNKEEDSSLKQLSLDFKNDIH